MCQEFNLNNLELNNGIKIIEASAGTGKTYNIAEIYLKLIVDKNLKPSEILVVTFTEAATAELRERVFEKLNANKLNQEFSDIGKQNIKNALNNFDEAEIFTIHGFCKKVLSENAFEAKALLNFGIKTNSDYLINDLVKDYWRENFYNNDVGFLEKLEQLNIDWDNIKQVIEKILNKPDIKVLYRDLTKDEEENLEIFNFKEIIDDIIKTVIEKYEIERKKSNILTYSELIQDVKNILIENTNCLKPLLVNKYKGFLIDEFQDTDAVQYEIFKKLFFEHNEMISFMIGDPKQSIYSFRGADINSYLKAVNDVEKDCRYTLKKNFRSSENILKAYNFLFKQIENPFLNDKIKYHEIDAGGKKRQKDLNVDFPLEFIHIETDANNIDSLEKKISEHVAMKVKELINDGESAENITVLVRKRKQGELIKNEFNKLSIHSVINLDDNVFNTNEAKELLNLLRAIQNYRNNSILARALSGIYINYDFIKLKELFIEENTYDIQNIYDNFSNVLEDFNKFGVSAALKKLDNLFEINKNLLQSNNFERHITNYHHLIELLEEYCHGKQKSLSNLINFLDDNIKTKDSISADDSKEQRLESDEKAVKIFTIHKSKGMEYPIVFIPFNFINSPVKTKFYYTYTDNEGKNTILLNPGKLKDGEKVLKAKEYVELEEAQEDMRLFYVAITRAVKKCIVYSNSYKLFHKTPLGRLLKIENKANDIFSSIKAQIDSCNFIKLEEGEINDIENIEAVENTCNNKSLKNLKLNREIDNSYRINSFSSINSKSGINEVFKELIDGKDDDVENDLLITVNSQEDEEIYSILNFPKGIKTGHFFHEILEEIDFTSG
ncbi:MAG: UvrD-helicase domain-containing protein, partial [Candidatus Muiribacteriota bacterium]